METVQMTTHGRYIEVNVQAGELPAFPITCPACGSTISALNYNGPSYARCAEYACGSALKWKSQIQNHTDKWAGRCPLEAK